MVVQSIRYLQLVMESGASLNAFGMLLFLSIPIFIEAVLPISLMVSILFFYNKIIMDSEVVIMRNAGASQFKIFKPALILAGALMVLIFVITGWLAPMSNAKMQLLRQDIRAQYASLLFREGIFNTVGSGLTAYIRERDDNGVLHGLMIHDTRDELQGGNAYTVVARRGVSVSDEDGQKVIVYEGTRQELDKQRHTLSRLDFEQYTINIPSKEEDFRGRWVEPDERSLPQLLNTDTLPYEDYEHVLQFIGEAHRRISLPFLLFSFTAICGCFLLIGSIDRRGLGKRIFGACIAVLAVQAAYMFAFNMTKLNSLASILLYLIPVGVIGLCRYLISPQGDRIVQSLVKKLKI
jgi:lipopolysaccharide export system permease protein